MPTWLFPHEREQLWRRRRRTAIALLACFLLLLIFDGAIFRRLLVAPAPARPPEDAPLSAHAEYEQQREQLGRAIDRLEESDFYRTFRVAGTMWPWLLIGGALVAQGTIRAPRLRALAGAGVALILAAALSGLAAEVLRTLIGRLRPIAADPPGSHQFKGLLERFRDPSNLGLPSSHAAVAFGAAFLLAFVYPRAGAIALLAAAGCGVSRMAVGAHFASDIFVSALVGYAVARLLRPGGWPGLHRRALLP